MEKVKGAPTELMAAASRCLLLGVTSYGKGACTLAKRDLQEWQRMRPVFD